jgi:hypothetical protein
MANAGKVWTPILNRVSLLSALGGVAMIRFVTIAAVAAAPFAFASIGHAQTDEQITRRIIRQSITNHPGRCACPFNLERYGQRCGARSAYARAVANRPICYASDVTPAMLQSAREGLQPKQQ